jgi:predicted TIM-barrel fold metal-dependent hydrolase
MPGAAAGIDLNAVVAIDVHTHAEVSAITGRGSLAPELERPADEYFGIRDRRRPTVEEMAACCRERKMVAVVFTVDATTSMGVPPVPNDEIAAAAHAHPDVLIPFGSVDSHVTANVYPRHDGQDRRSRRPPPPLGAYPAFVVVLASDDPDSPWTGERSRSRH